MCINFFLVICARVCTYIVLNLDLDWVFLLVFLLVFLCVSLAGSSSQHRHPLQDLRHKITQQQQQRQQQQQQQQRHKLKPHVQHVREAASSIDASDELGHSLAEPLPVVGEGEREGEREREGVCVCVCVYVLVHVCMYVPTLCVCWCVQGYQYCLTEQQQNIFFV